MEEAVTELGPWRHATYQRIVEATIDAIEAKGEAGVRLVEVAEVAEVSKTLIYHYFGDREGLIAAAEAARYLRMVTPGIEQAAKFVESCSTPAEWTEFVTGVYRVGTSAAGSKRRSARFQILGSAVSRPRLRAAVVEANNTSVVELAAVLDRAQERGLMGRRLSGFAISVWLQGLMLSRHLAEITDDVAQEDAWDAVTAVVVKEIFS